MLDYFCMHSWQIWQYAALGDHATEWISESSSSLSSPCQGNNNKQWAACCQNPEEAEGKVSWKQINFTLSSALSRLRGCWKIVSRYRDRLEKTTNFGSPVEIWVIVRLSKECVGNAMICVLVSCVCKTILGSCWLPGLTAGKCRVTPQCAWRAGLQLWKLNPEQDSITLLSTRDGIALEPSCPCNQPSLLPKSHSFPWRQPCFRFCVCLWGETGLVPFHLEKYFGVCLEGTFTWSLSQTAKQRKRFPVVHFSLSG